MNRALLLLIIGIFWKTMVMAQIAVHTDQIPLDSTFNTRYNEINVVLSPDDNFLYFTRANHPQNKGGKSDSGDIWVSELTVEGVWSTPVNDNKLNDENFNQVVGFLDPRTLLTQGENGLMTHYQYDGKWWEPKEFEIPYFKNAGEQLSACVSTDANYILFGMESFGTYGVEDLYVSQKGADGTWSSPKNLGSNINTKFQEITPFLAPDNKTIIFSTNGRGGEGSFDLFISTRLDDTWQQWTEPKNLGNLVNTQGRESSFVFSLEEEYAHLISTQNSEGYGDIKKVKIKPEIILPPKKTNEPGVAVESVENMVLLTGKVLNEKNGEPLVGAEIFLESLDGMKRYKANTNSVGQFVVNVGDTSDYVLKVSARHFLSYENDLKRENLPSFKNKEISLKLIEEGVTVSLERVLFDRGTSELLPGSEKELNLVVEMMKLNPEVTIFLAGHTDNQGSSSANLQLSQDRVETVRKYLSKHGVRKNRITGKGFGGTMPRASNSNPTTRQLNRRVEFTIHLKEK